MGYLQLGAHAGENSPVLAPVGLEGLTGTENQGNECAAAGGLLGHQALLLPEPGEGRHTVLGAAKTERRLMYICLTVRRCLRDRPASVLRQPESFKAKGSSPEGLTRLA